jgi:hypothetical protein
MIKENSKLESVLTDGDTTTIHTDRQTIKISQYHMQDCCENVWIELSKIADDLKSMVGRELTSLNVVKILEHGILFIFGFGYVKKKIFCPAWNEQNGYYGSDLELIVEVDGLKSSVDISDCEDSDGIH